VFKVLARRWKLIVAVTLVPTMVVAGLLLFVIKPTFTSTATVLVSQQEVIPQDLGPLAILVASQPVATVATYADLARELPFYQEVIQRLKLSEKPWHFTASTLASVVRVTSAVDAKVTNVIGISVTLTDKDVAAGVANALAEQLVQRGNGMVATEQLNSYRAYLRALRLDIQAQETALVAKRAALVGVSRVLTTTKSIVDDQTLLDVAQATSNLGVLDLAKLSLVSQEVNPLWESLTNDISTISTDIATKTGLEKICEGVIAQLESPSKDNASWSPIRIEQRAVPPDVKDAGGRVAKVAITFVAALLLGILLAFLVDYLEVIRATEAANHHSRLKS